MTSVREHILDGTPEDVIERYGSLGDVAKDSDFGPLDRNVVVLDTETTGLSFMHDELIQIAAARLEEGEIVDWYVTYVDPGRTIPEGIVQLTGITNADVAGAPSPDEALRGLAEFVGDAMVVAHNASFDKHFTTKHPAGYPLLENRWIDSLDLSRIALPRLRSHRLIDLVRTFDAPVSTHRADDDVAATCVIYRILLAGVSLMPLSLVAYIGSMAPESQWPTGYVFSTLASMIEEAEDPEGAPKPEASKRALSLATLRRHRVSALPALQARKDPLDMLPELVYPTSESIDLAFSPSGLLGAIYPSYEERAEQEAMAQSVRDAYEEGSNLVVEAGTGVGKSMAYLVTSSLFAQENQIAVGVATKTNSLLDQLVYQELPALADALAQEYPDRPPLRWAPLKGMSHYPCLRKIQNVVDEGPTMREIAGTMVSQAPPLAALLSFIDQSEFSDMDALKIDYRALPRYMIASTSHECLRRKCPFYNKYCFVHGARRRAESADILVTNHSLLFCDMATDGGLLPTARYWVIDEAHAIESEARAAFAYTVSSDGLGRLATRIDGQRRSNLLVRAENALSTGDEGQMAQFLRMLSSARSAASKFSEAVDDYRQQVKELLFFDPTSSKRGQVYDTVEIWINEEVRHSTVFHDVAIVAEKLVEEADRLIKSEQDLVAYLEGIDEAAVIQRELAAHTLELREQRDAAEVIFGAPSDAYVYQAKLSRKKDRFNDELQAQLLNIGEKMNETLFARTQSVVFASATLSIDGGFDVFEQAVGLGTGEFSEVRELQLDSSYDFDNNMIIYLVSDMPEPNEPGYTEALNRLLIEAHRANNGSILSLFTNRREMESSYGVVSDALKADGLRVVCQKWGVSPKTLRDDFLADENLSLFALKTFWEGFDAPGSTLSGVIIPRLPFGRPTDPLYCERASRDDRAWWRYVLPQAVIETKQAAGRLIRKADDRGVLILADKRLITKPYRNTFLNSLQSRTVRVDTIDGIVEALRAMGN